MATRQNILPLVSDCLSQMKEGRPYRVEIKQYYKPRSTGKKSQNHHIYGHAVQIGAEAGMTKKEVIFEAQERSLVKGFPMKVNTFGRIVPVPEEELDTKGAAILIEELHDMAAFLDVRLKESNPEEVEV